MDDLTTRSILQLSAGAGRLQEAGSKPVSPTDPSELPGEFVPKAVEKAREAVNPSSGSGFDTKSGSEEKTTYTILICKCSGESRAVSIKASNSEAAKTAAKFLLDEGEEVASVDESTVAAPADPNRGVLI